MSRRRADRPAGYDLVPEASTDPGAPVLAQIAQVLLSVLEGLRAYPPEPPPALTLQRNLLPALVPLAVAAAVARARRMVAEGADLLDVGGASSRPGHAPVPAAEEAARIAPVIAALAAALPQYSLKKEAVPVPVERREATLEGLVRLVKGRKVETIDGVKIHEADGWVLVRPAGTETLFRVYAEAKTPERAQALAAEGAELVRRAVKG